ncbi:ABC transporter ATP-binding protein [Evansella tamaricis]|uniref:ABC transporter ATP-binding protein n=1 Tax=Evansella tamaricis TaxID=2069301 RepID=A0ABS6JNE3_9BACI|nr:ABC transporter ATP-binding protein [Evansella tamaricis]MBU9714352.1 ABC transporter ATP-binding protein [Evansella tamaricis]
MDTSASVKSTDSLQGDERNSERNKIIETVKLTKSFGGHTAVSDVSLSIFDKELKSIIGPNGAGKTTFFNLLSGQMKPTSGEIFYKGNEIQNLPPHKRTKLGIGRSFQITNVFPTLTVLENVRLAVQAKHNIHYSMFRHYKYYKHLEEEAYQSLEKVKLEPKAEHLASSLAHGEKRKLEIAILLSLDTQLLLLDEPTAGMSVDEVPQIIEVIESIRDQRDRTIILIEHKIDLVKHLSDTIAVLFHGKKLADGSPEEIMNNDQVQSAYLGGLYNDAED